MPATLRISPVTLWDARIYCEQVHRHLSAPQGGLFAIACAEGTAIRGVVIVGRPIARLLQDGYTAEVTRLATDGVKNGCSMLYGAAWRAARAMGYRRLVTYTMEGESGVSLLASGWRFVATTDPKSWNRAARPRVDRAPLQVKIRWEMTA
jgi:hypothetical protein